MFEWLTDENAFETWCQGQTGYPIIDAALRQLGTTRWIPNRACMIFVSCLTKRFLIDWRAGEKWFRRYLIDANQANNVCNWQWIAGCGADAAPFFRVFNPILQGEKFDPDGAYAKRFCPELKELSPEFIHKPFKALPSILKEACVILGDTYPAPYIDHEFSRRRALDFKTFPFLTCPLV